jgi:hypothetical protein
MHMSDGYSILPTALSVNTTFIGIFVLSWIVSTLIYKIRSYDAIEAKEAHHLRTEIPGDRVVTDKITSGGGN